MSDCRHLWKNYCICPTFLPTDSLWKWIKFGLSALDVERIRQMQCFNKKSQSTVLSLNTTKVLTYITYTKAFVKSEKCNHKYFTESIINVLPKILDFSGLPYTSFILLILMFNIVCVYLYNYSILKNMYIYMYKEIKLGIN